MRHLNKTNHLGRTASHRKALMANMSASLIIHKRINTTLAKAKALRIYVEPVLNRSKEDTTHNRRMAFSYLGDKDAVKELFRVISPKIVSRPGGFTRILKTGARPGDNSNMCFIELVDFNDTLLGTKKTEEGEAKKGGTRRSRKKGGSTAEAGAAKKEAEASA